MARLTNSNTSQRVAGDGILAGELVWFISYSSCYFNGLRPNAISGCVQSSPPDKAAVVGEHCPPEKIQLMPWRRAHSLPLPHCNLAPHLDKASAAAGHSLGLRAPR